jgi:hypothetical protein
MKKLALALISASALVFGFGMVAEAQYGTTPAVTASPSTVVAGGTTTVTATGCTPPEVLTFTITGGASQTATCVAGSASVQLAVASSAGTYPGTVVGSLGFSQPFSIVVTAPTTPPGGLPATGSDGIGATTGMAIGLLMVGLGLFAVAQFRRRQAPLTA